MIDNATNTVASVLCIYHARRSLDVATPQSIYTDTNSCHTVYHQNVNSQR